MNKLTSFFKSPYPYLLIIAIGIFYKVYYLDSKYYWLDEIYTLQQSSGQSIDEFAAQFPENEIKNISFYHDQLHLNTKNIRWRDQLNGMLSTYDFTPAHYVFLSIWHRLVGDDYLHYRLFSIFCFFISLIFIFLFCRSVFKSNLTAWIAISIFSVSPYIHVFIQDARYYILWIAVIFMLNYFYTNYFNSKKWKWLIAYTLLGAISLYASTLSALIIIGHFIHFILFRRKYLFHFILSLLAIAIMYLPYFYHMLVDLDSIVNSYTWQLNWKENQSFWEPAAMQLFGLAHSFFNFESHIWGSHAILFSNYDNELIFSVVFAILFTFLIIFSFIHLIKNQKKETWSLFLLLTLPTLVFLYFLDIIRDSFVSSTWRYIIIIMIIIIIVVSFYLSHSLLKRKTIIYLIVVSVCIFSLHRVSSFECWYSFEEECESRLKEASILDDEVRPLIVTNMDHWMGLMGFISLVVESKSEHIDILRLNSDHPAITSLINPSLYSGIYTIMSLPSVKDSLRSLFPEKFKSFGPLKENRTINFLIKTNVLPDSSKLYITGNHEYLGYWDPAKIELTKLNDTIWSTNISIEEEQLLEFKFTLGSWETEALNEEGISFQNFSLNVEVDTIIRLAFSKWNGIID